MSVEELAIRYKIAYNLLEDALCRLEDVQSDVDALRHLLNIAEEALFRAEEPPHKRKE